MCYIGSELWESKFDGLLALVKEYIVAKTLSQSSHSRPSTTGGRVG